MKLISKAKISGIIILLLLVIGGYLYFKYFFTYEQKNMVRRQFETITGQNLTVTIFDLNGKVIKKWSNIKKITSGRSSVDKGERNYTFFYTVDNKYVQIPDSIWYIAEEE